MKSLRDLAIRVTNLLGSTIVLAVTLLAAPFVWSEGQLVDVKQNRGFYEYRIVAGGDRYTGRSLHLYRLPQGGIKFAIHGSSLYILDENGKTRKTRYIRQELMPPPIRQSSH